MEAVNTTSGSESERAAEGFSPPEQRRVFIAASGTGGHLIPAIQIARALRALKPEWSIEFIGVGKPLEEELIVKGGFARHIVETSGVKKRGLTGILLFIAKLPHGLLQLRRLFRDKPPSLVVGVGGYVSVLPVLYAWWRRIPTWVHEAEIEPGMANTLLGRFVSSVSTAFPETKLPGSAKHTYTGHPVRPEFAAVPRDTLPESTPANVLVMGGSQGARAIDQAFMDLTPFLAERGITLVHQSRPENMERVLEAYKRGGIKAHVVSFIEDMPGAFGWAHLVVSRSGASAVMEISAVNRPAIFVPYPHQQGQHQTKNAMTLVTQGKALLVEEGPRFVERLRSALEELLDAARYREVKERPYSSRSLDAAERIAKGCIELVEPAAPATAVDTTTMVASGV